MNITNLFPKKYRIALTIAAFITLPMILLGMWFLWRELFWDHWKKSTKVEAPSVQSITKESVDKLNQITKWGKKSDCGSIDNEYLKNSCYDQFTLSEARKSPTQAEDICKTMKESFRINECLSSVNMGKALDTVWATPSSGCEKLPDILMRASCIDEKETNALNKERSKWKVRKEFCNSLVNEELQKACLSYVSP